MTATIWRKGSASVSDNLAIPSDPTVTTSGVDPYPREFTRTIPGHVVDNENYAYMVQIYWAPGPNYADFYIYKVRVKYTISSPLP